MIFAVAVLLASSLLDDLAPGETASAAVAPQPAVAVAPEVKPAEKPVVEEAKPAEKPVEKPVAEETKPEEKPVSGEAKPAEKVPKKAKKGPAEKRSVKITSDRTDYDRKDGVIMFDRNVFVDDAEYKMHADRLFVFLDGTNDLRRIVALGNVAITNDARVGTCAKATYTKAASKIVMYSDGTNAMARLCDNGKRKSEVEGRRITFWIDTEQVEVEGSTVTLDAGGIGGKEGAKKLLGK